MRSILLAIYLSNSPNLLTERCQLPFMESQAGIFIAFREYTFKELNRVIGVTDMKNKNIMMVVCLCLLIAVSPKSFGQSTDETLALAKELQSSMSQVTESALVERINQYIELEAQLNEMSKDINFAKKVGYISIIMSASAFAGLVWSGEKLYTRVLAEGNPSGRFLRGSEADAIMLRFYRTKSLSYGPADAETLKLLKIENITSGVAVASAASFLGSAMRISLLESQYQKQYTQLVRETRELHQFLLAAKKAGAL
jgi:hypothetical protein